MVIFFNMFYIFSITMYSVGNTLYPSDNAKRFITFPLVKRLSA